MWVQLSPTQPKTGAKIRYTFFHCVVENLCNCVPIPSFPSVFLAYLHCKCSFGSLGPRGSKQVVCCDKVLWSCGQVLPRSAWLRGNHLGTCRKFAAGTNRGKINDKAKIIVLGLVTFLFHPCAECFLFHQKQTDCGPVGWATKVMRGIETPACSINLSTILYLCLFSLLEELFAYKRAALVMSSGFSRPAGNDGYVAGPVSRTCGV